ncbi:MAG: T9SS type A sorting domain-containing protein [bacterium]|nr:T9SS type A sorting domain-containing protein [bacterium]
MHIKKLLWILLLFPALAWSQGISWGPRVRVDDAAGSGAHPAIHPYTIIDDSLASNPRVYTVWEDDRDGNGRHAIYFARSTDLAATYSRPNVVVCNDSLDNVYPWMVKGASGAIYIVWQVKYPDTYWRIYLSKSTDGGATFSLPDTIRGPSILNNKDDANNYGLLPRIAVDPRDSILYLVWTEATGALATKIRCSRSLTKDNNFSGMVRVNVDSARAAKHPAIACGDSGKVFVTYERSDGGNTNDPQCDIYFNQSNDYGLSFGATELLINDNGDVARMQNPTIDRINNKTMVIWEDTRTGVAASNAQPVLFFSQKADSSAAFSANVRVSDTLSGTWNYRPRMAIDQTTGNMIVVWHSNLGSTDSLFELRLCAFNDTINEFTPSYKMFDTYTGNSGANFGNIFYPPAVAITNIDSVANFFLVWRDLIEDTTGNIYSRHGHVVISQVDLDIFPDVLDAAGDSLNFGALPAGPAYVSRSFRLVNTRDSLNPDSLDGPSTAVIDSLTANGITLHNVDNSALTLSAGFIESPASFPALSIGQTLDVTVTLYVPEGTPAGRYLGYAKLRAVGNDLTVDTDSIRIVVQGPSAATDLENLRVFPNPFKPYIGHTVVNFEGLTSLATIRIYDIKGRLVEEIAETNGDGLATWAAKAASGVYIYSVTNPQGAKKTGKIAIIR